MPSTGTKTLKKGKIMRELVGHVGVDAGLIWIGDPCYIIHAEKSPMDSTGQDWGEFCDEFNKRGGDSKSVASFPYPLGHEGLGVCMNTAYGDGTYPVYVERDKSGRIIKATIEFDQEEEEEEEE